MELLENRRMLSAVSWVGNGDGHSWASAANWSTGVISGATDDVTVNAPPGTSIQGPGISTTIKSLDIRSANLTLSGPDFTVMGAINVSSGQSLAVSAGTLSAMTISVDNASLGLSGGTLINTTITKSGASQVSLGGSTLEGITLNGDYSITSGVAIIHNGMTLNGTLTLGDSSTPSLYGALAFQGSQVIGGAGAIVFGSDNTRNALTQQTDGASITIGSGITVRGKTGYLGYDPLHVSSPTAVVINDGTIEWTAGTNIVVPTTLTNNGTLSIDSTGHMVLQGTVIGGRITGVAGATLLNVTLDSTTLEGDFLVANGVATVHNGITLNGTMTLGDPSTPNLYGALAFQGNATIDGTGTIVFGNDNTRNALTQQTDGASITIGSGITVRGKTGYLGYDPLHVSSPTAVVVNHGTIEWTAGTNIVVPKTLINHGTLSVSTAGVMDLQGTVVGGRITGVNGARLRTFTVDGATLEGVFTVANSSYLTAFNGLTLNGTVTLGDAATPGQMGSIDFIGTQALSGAGTIVFGNSNIANTLRQGTVDATLTIGAGITVRGETGFIGYNPNRSGTTAVNIVNLGTISADVAGGTITVFGGAGGLNSGSVRAFNGGSVTISGSNWKSTGVLFAASNSSLSLGASFANAGSTMAMSGPGTVILSGNVTGGVIAVEIGTSLVVAGGTWDGVTVNGDFRLVGNSYVTALNGLVLNGTATLGDAAVPGQWGSIDFNGTQTLGGSGTVVFGNSNVANTLRQGIVNATLTLGAGITIRGKTGYIGYNPNRSGETAVNVINLGTMLWSAGTDIRFGTSLTNRGIIRVDDTGVLNVGGTLIGGVITAQTGARFHGGTLDGVTVNGDFRVIDSSYVTVLGGLTLNGTVTLGDPAAPGQWGSLDFIGTQTLGGAGTVIFGNSNLANTLRQGTSDATLTIGAGINIRGQTGYIGYNPNRSGAPNVNVVNLGVIEGIAGTSINIPGGVTNRGSIRNTTGTVLSISNFSQTDGQSYLSTAPGSTIAIDGDLIGSTQASAAFVNSGEVRILGGTSGTPRLLEAMSLDRGVQGSSTISNFYYSVLRLGTSANVQLVDQHRNSAGNLPDVIYAGTLIVPAGATLDLNGLILYARQAKIDGTIIGGTIHSIPDSGPLTVGSTTPGAIQTPGELDEWTFYSRASRTMTIQVNPSASGSNAAIAPVLDRAQMTLIDPAGNIVATATNASIGGIFELDDVVLATEGTYRLQLRAAAGFSGNTGNYNLVAYDSTAEISNTTLGKVANGTIENAFSIDRWDFNAAQNQQLRLNVKALTSPDLAFTLTGPNGFTAFTDLSVTSDLVTLPSTGTYHVTVRGRNGATGKYSYVLDETSVTDVNLGQVVTATNAGTNAAQLFRIHVPTAEAMVIRLDDSVDTNRNLVLVKYGAPPTLGVYDYSSFNPVASLLGISSSDSTEADHSLLVPSATVGDWYVLVVGGHVPSPSTFTIQAATSNLVLTQTMPVKFSANSNVDLTLTGAGFKAGAIVQLVGGSNNVVATASQVEIDSFTQISATVSLTGVAPGTYGIRVTLPDGNGDFLPQSFTVLPAGQAKLETRLIMPGFLGHHVNATIYVEFANTGTAPMAAPLLRLQSADGGFDQPILTLDQNLAASGLWINESAATLPDGFSESVQILASGATPGVLNPGERISVPVYFVGLHRPQTLFEVNLHLELRSFDATSQDAIPWSSLRDGLRPPTIPDDAWSVIYGNVIANVGSTWGDFVEMLSDNAKYLNRLGRRVVDVGELWSFELQQAIGFGPVRTLATSIDAAVTATGTDLSFGRLWSAALDQRFETSALGRGWSTPWQVQLTVGANGSVDIFGAGGSHRRFEKDARLSTGFIAPPGETGTLVIVSPDVYEIREQSGFITRFKSNGQLDFTQDANGNRVTAGYDGSARLISLTHSNGASIAVAYNAAGLIQSLLDSENRLTTFTYDASNQYLLSATGPDGVVTSYTYDTTANSPKQHALTSVTTGGVTRAFLYDNRGRLAAVLTRLSPTTETARIDFNYDSAGRVSVSDAGGGTVNLFYDDRGLLTKVTDQFGNVTTAEYGNDLRISRIVDPLGQSQAFTWCGCGSLTSKTDQLGNKTSFNYDYVGPANSIRRMTSFTDANGNTTRYTYDNNGNLTSTIYPNGSIERTTAYDPMGDPLTYINRRGQAMSYAYNAAGQVTRQTFDDGSFIDMAYDARGNLSTVTEPGNQVTTYTYDSGDRLTKVLYPQGRFLEFTYDAAGRRSSMTDQLGYVVNYAYDAAGRLFRLTDGSN